MDVGSPRTKRVKLSRSESEQSFYVENLKEMVLKSQTYFSQLYSVSELQCLDTFLLMEDAVSDLFCRLWNRKPVIFLLKNLSYKHVEVDVLEKSLLTLQAKKFVSLLKGVMSQEDRRRCKDVVVSKKKRRKVVIDLTDDDEDICEQQGEKKEDAAAAPLGAAQSDGNEWLDDRLARILNLMCVDALLELGKKMKIDFSKGGRRKRALVEQLCLVSRKQRSVYSLTAWIKKTVTNTISPVFENNMSKICCEKKLEKGRIIISL